VVDRSSLRLAPDELWALVEPLIPTFRLRPQSGGTAPLDDRAVFMAVVCVLSSGGWRELAPSFGVPFQTAHRRFGQWTKAGRAQAPPRGPGRTRQPGNDRLIPPRSATVPAYGRKRHPMRLTVQAAVFSA
jgi:hypothetical protein